MCTWKHPSGHTVSSLSCVPCIGLCVVFSHLPSTLPFAPAQQSMRVSYFHLCSSSFPLITKPGVTYTPTIICLPVHPRLLVATVFLNSCDALSVVLKNVGIVLTQQHHLSLSINPLLITSTCKIITYL